jgi:hypothetical protein
MFAFGLGTLPNLTATGLLIDRAKPVFSRTTLQFNCNDRCPLPLPDNYAAIAKITSASGRDPHRQPEETTMTRHTSQPGRRRFIKISVAGLAAAPFANALLSGTAEAVDTLSESDPTATALGYKMDATKAGNRTDKTAVCSNCSLYSGKPGAADGPCSVFGGKLVNAKGWCTAWVKKA